MVLIVWRICPLGMGMGNGATPVLMAGFGICKEVAAPWRSNAVDLGTDKVVVPVIHG